jgi:hypothetical protein
MRQKIKIRIKKRINTGAGTSSLKRPGWIPLTLIFQVKTRLSGCKLWFCGKIIKDGSGLAPGGEIAEPSSCSLLKYSLRSPLSEFRTCW